MLGNTQLRKTLDEMIVGAELDQSALRPASIDLSVGRIIVPPESDDDQPQVTTTYSVPVGGTLIIETSQKLNIPATHAGLMFPKSSALAEKGILITNFGCVDPGYSGHLKFVVINLGRKAYGVRTGDKIVTLTLFRLDEEANPDYQAFISGKPPSLSIEETSKLLAHDFVDVERRASEQATNAVRSGILGFGAVLSLFIVIPSILIALAPPFLETWYSYGRSDTRLDAIEQLVDLELQKISKEIMRIEEQVRKISQP